MKMLRTKPDHALNKILKEWKIKITTQVNKSY